MLRHKAIGLLFLLLPHGCPVYAQQDDSLRLHRLLLDSVTITAPPRPVSYFLHGVSTVMVAAAEMTNSDGTTLAGPLNAVPGIFMHSGTFSTNRLTIRGMGSRTPYNTNRLSAFINHIPITGYDGVTTPEDIEPSFIDKIEIVKGTTPVTEATTMGGTLRFFTPESDSNCFNLVAQFGQWNTYRLASTGSYLHKQFTLFTGLARQASDGYRENSSYFRNALVVSLRWKAARTEVKSTFYLSDLKGFIPSSIDQTLFDNQPKAAAPNWQAIRGYKTQKKIIGGIKADTRLGKNLCSSLITFGRMSGSFEKRPFNHLDDDTRAAGFISENRLQTGNLTWTFGGRGGMEEYGWKIWLNDTLLNRNRDIRVYYGLFIEVGMKLSQYWEITVGNALDKISYKLIDLYLANGDQSGKRNFPSISSPRLTVTGRLSPSARLYLIAGYGYSMPSPEETLLPAGDINPDLLPEKGLQLETGVKGWLLNEFVRAELALFHMRLSKLLITKRFAEDIFMGINAGKTFHQGVELTASTRFGVPLHQQARHTLVLSYIFQEHRFIDFIDDGANFSGNSLPGIPRQTLQATFGYYPIKRLSFRVINYLAGRQFLNDTNNGLYRGHWLVNLHIEYNTVSTGSYRAQLFCGVNNLFNQPHASMILVNAPIPKSALPRYYYPGLSFHLFAGIRLGL